MKKSLGLGALVLGIGGSVLLGAGAAQAAVPEQASRTAAEPTPPASVTAADLPWVKTILSTKVGEIVKLLPKEVRPLVKKQIPGYFLVKEMPLSQVLKMSLPDSVKAALAATPATANLLG